MDEDGWVRLSLLEHHAYCPRQAWLVNEGVWQDNHLTVTGTAEHDRVDTPGRDHRRGVRVHHRVPVASQEYRVHGFADAVEEGVDGSLLPVEHKHGRGAGSLAPAVLQAVGQALCLTEMTGRPVPQVAVFVAMERHRHLFEVADYRARFEELVAATRVLLGSPLPPTFAARSLCGRCSLSDACQPPHKVAP